MITWTLELTTDEVEAIREIIDPLYDTPNPPNTDLDNVRRKIAIIREEPMDDGTPF